MEFNKMPQEKILIVEDEAIVAEDIADSLRSLGYVVVGVVASYQVAVKHSRLARAHGC
jgi:CheY-like chemotaxis protein